MFHGMSLFALATRQLLETLGPAVRIFSMPPFYVMNIDKLTYCNEPHVEEFICL